MNQDDLPVLELETREWITSAGPLGLILKGDMPQRAWSEVISKLARQAGAIAQKSNTHVAWLGDLLAHGACRRYKGQIKAYAEAAGLAPSTLRCAKLVCLRIPPGDRNEKLTWSHHAEIAHAFSDAGAIREWLSAAEREGWPKAELRKRIRDAKKEADPPPHAPVAGSPVFLLLRELRGLDRVIQANQRTWRNWPTETCELALTEVAEVVAFIDELQSRVQGGTRQSRAS